MENTCEVFSISILRPICRRELPVLEVVLPVVLADFPQDPTGVAHRNDIRRNILCNHAASADHDVVADGDAGHDHGAGANPAVTSNVYGEIILISFLPGLRTDRMTCSRNRYIGAEHGIVPYINVSIIYQRQVKLA